MNPNPSAALEPETHADLLPRLGRRFRGPTLRVDFELCTAAARQIFRRDFVYVSQQLVALEASRRVQGIDRQLLDGALAAVSRAAVSARASLAALAAGLDAVAAGHPAADAGAVVFARPAPLRATIVSPNARIYLAILADADAALIRLERAWLLGLLDPAERARQLGACRKVPQAFKERVREERHRVGNHVREVNAARRPGSGAQTTTGSGSSLIPNRP